MKKNDRVRYAWTKAPSMYGKLGTVQTVDEDVVVVQFDGESTVRLCLRFELEVV